MANTQTITRKPMEHYQGGSLITSSTISSFNGNSFPAIQMEAWLAEHARIAVERSSENELGLPAFKLGSSVCLVGNLKDSELATVFSAAHNDQDIPLEKIFSQTGLHSFYVYNPEEDITELCELNA